MQKVVLLLNSWDKVLGGPKGRFPHFSEVSNDLKSSGVSFFGEEEKNEGIIDMKASAQKVTTFYQSRRLLRQAEKDAVERRVVAEMLNNGVDYEEIFEDNLELLDLCKKKLLDYLTSRSLVGVSTVKDVRTLASVKERIRIRAVRALIPSGWGKIRKCMMNKGIQIEEMGDRRS
ncbi:OLC1v1000606C1 [Oldenlandia corymbosa var. corymbosa]|uniref:OLC1v1000606C1 n=1 Tax=Oldenlandia corymbosa var. corymbosa TaxID=529605 RepID=A0AAV1D3M6_OLDCO|nr:OLC1v1000606C1 [Oldenlandia corymbosa var. corymbosa]